jgi:hypothetical protein
MLSKNANIIAIENKKKLIENGVLNRQNQPDTYCMIKYAAKNIADAIHNSSKAALVVVDHVEP